jgi:hypothetical protein
MQAKAKHSPEFLTTVRPLNNDERRWEWERRKRNRADRKADDMRYLAVWLIAFVIGAAGLFCLMAFPPCLWIWSAEGIHCIN